jgi:hypothetical protein
VATLPTSAPPGSRRADVPSLTRRRYLDHVKVIIIAAIIFGHGVLSYSAWELWSYADVRETTLSPATEGVLVAVLSPMSLVITPLLFLIAGLFARAVRHRGAAAFASGRLLRLGVPCLAFVGVIWPALLYALYRPLGNAPGSYWREFVGAWPDGIDTGYFWFVVDLLLFSLLYAAWVGIRRRRRTGSRQRTIHLQHLAVLAGGVAVANFLVRLGFPVGSESFVDLNLFQWPESIGLFGLGIAAADANWLTVLPARLERLSRAVSLVAVGALAAIITTSSSGGATAN